MGFKVKLEVVDIPETYFHRDFQRVDFGFWSSLFDLLIEQHGVPTRIQKVIICPCLDADRRPNPFCNKCNGRGKFYEEYGEDQIFWYGFSKRYGELGMEVPVYREEGTASITYKSKHNFQLWDRLKPYLSFVGFQQVFEIRGNSVIIPYDPVSISDIYFSDGSKVYEIDKFSVEIVEMEGNDIDEPKKFIFPTELEGKITIRYFGRPWWYIVELPAETRLSQTRFMLPREFLKAYPKYATVKRADFINM